MIEEIEAHGLRHARANDRQEVLLPFSTREQQRKYSRRGYIRRERKEDDETWCDQLIWIGGRSSTTLVDGQCEDALRVLYSTLLSSSALCDRSEFWNFRRSKRNHLCFWRSACAASGMILVIEDGDGGHWIGVEARLFAFLLPLIVHRNADIRCR